MAKPPFSDRDSLTKVYRRHHIRSLALLGSTLNSGDHAGSDVDLLVDFEPGQVPSLLGMAQIELELSSLVGSHKVDLRTKAELSRHFRDDVVRAAEVQYDA